MDYNDLDLNLIKTFLAVYENKSISLASKKLFVSQPAITSSIKKLEKLLGAKLFIRNPKGVLPTNEGVEFNRYCYNAMTILDSGIKKVASLSKLEEGVLNIGSSSTIIRKLLLPFIEHFNKEYPKIIITITDSNSEKLTKYVKNGSVDLAVLNMPINNEELFKVMPILQTHDCFIASTNNKLNYISVNELKNERLILQKRPSSNRDYFDKMCELNDIVLTPTFEIGSFGLITDFVSKDMGIGYTIKEFVQEDVNAGRVKVLNTNFISKPRDISIITPQTSTNSFTCNKFIEELIEYYKKTI